MAGLFDELSRAYIITALIADSEVYTLMPMIAPMRAIVQSAVRRCRLISLRAAIIGFSRSRSSLHAYE